MPKPTPEQKALQRDKATIRVEVAKLRSAETSSKDRGKAEHTIAMTVLKKTGLAATDKTPQMLARLTTELLDNGSVGLSGMNTAIQGAALKLDISKTEIDSIPEIVKERLDKLV